MDVEFFEKVAVKHASFVHVFNGSNPLSHKVTPPSLLLNSLAVPVSCLSSLPYLNFTVLVRLLIYRLQLTHAHLYLIPKYITVTLIQSLQTIRLQTLRSIRLFMFLILN